MAQGSRPMSAAEREARRARLHAAGDWAALMNECEPIIKRTMRGVSSSQRDDALQTLRAECLEMLVAWRPDQSNLSTYLSARLRGALLNLLAPPKHRDIGRAAEILGYRFEGAPAADSGKVRGPDYDGVRPESDSPAATALT